MPNDKQESSRQELYKAGKIERRRSTRPALVPDKVEEQNVEEDTVDSKLRPEIVVLALMVILLLIITAVAI